MCSANWPFLGRHDLAHVQPDDAASSTVGRGVEGDRPANLPVSHGMVRGNTGKFRVVSSGEPAGSAAASPRPANVQPTAARTIQPTAGTRPVVLGGGSAAATAFKRDFEAAPLDLSLIHI